MAGVFPGMKWWGRLAAAHEGFMGQASHPPSSSRHEGTICCPVDSCDGPSDERSLLGVLDLRDFLGRLESSGGSEAQ